VLKNYFIAASNTSLGVDINFISYYNIIYCLLVVRTLSLEGLSITIKFDNKNYCAGGAMVNALVSLYTFVKSCGDRDLLNLTSLSWA